MVAVGPTPHGFEDPRTTDGRISSTHSRVRSSEPSHPNEVISVRMINRQARKVALQNNELRRSDVPQQRSTRVAMAR
jgi:hypothetical protein